MADITWSSLWKGDFNASTQYEVSECVSYNGSSYTCILRPSIGTLPTDTTYWKLLAQKGDKGDTGATGSQGPQGIQGVKGDTGNDGVSTGLLYAFNTNTADSDPGNGQIKLNNATLSSVNQLFIDNLENGGADVSTFINTWDDSTDPNVRGTLKITKKGAEANFAIFNVTGAVVDGTGYRKIPVSHIASTGSFSASDLLSIIFSRTGNKGADGEGSGDVIGPGSAVDSNFAAFDTVTGKLIKDSGSKASDFDAAGTAATVQGNLDTHTGATTAHGIATTVEHNADGTHKTALVTTLKASGAEVTTGTEDAKIATPKAIKDAGIVALSKAAGSDIDTGTDDSKFVTAKAIADSAVSTASKTQTLTNKTIVQKVTAYTPEAAATVTIDATTGGIHRITCPAGNFSITISNEAAGQCLIIEVVKDNSTTARTITFNDTVTWITSGGTQPTYTTTANGMTTFGLRCTGNNAFEGYLVGTK
jgi:hypothetical protein